MLCAMKFNCMPLSFGRKCLTPVKIILIRMTKRFVNCLGRGTSTDDGFGIAAALLESLLVDAKSTIFCATHFHDLTTYFNDDHPRNLESKTLYYLYCCFLLVVCY